MTPAEIAKLTPEQFQAQLPKMEPEQRAECIAHARELLAVKQNGRPVAGDDEVWLGFLGLLQCALAGRGGS